MQLPTRKGAVPWLNDHVVFLTRAGSQAYGTALPTSDLDIRGVAIAPAEYYLGFLNRFEQATFTEPDAVVYNITKFMDLAANCNPSVLEILFTDPSDYLVMTPIGEKLVAARKMFLSKKARYSFVGYAMSQLKRIVSHRKWLLDPPSKQPERKDFGLPEQAALSKDKMGVIESLVQDQLQSWDVNWESLDPAARIAFRGEMEQSLTEMGLGTPEARFGAAARHIGVEENFLNLIQRERQYQGAKKNWKQFQEWKRNRNVDRAAMEAEFGYDAKHAMHLVRLCRMGGEVLERGEVIVKRPDAQELLSIRAGAWDYDELVAWARAQELRMAELYVSSTAVPMQPNRTALDALCLELVQDALAGRGMNRLLG